MNGSGNIPQHDPAYDPRAAAAPERGRDLIRDHTSGGGGGGGTAEPEYGGGRGAGSGAPNPLRGTEGPSAAGKPGGGTGSKAKDALNSAAKNKGLPTLPEGGTGKEKLANAGGQVADQAARKYANSMGVPDPVYDRAKKLLNSKAGRNMLDKTPAGRLLNNSKRGRAFRDSFLGQDPRNGKDEKADASGSGSGSGSGKYRVAIGVGGIGALPLVLLLALPLALGANLSGDDSDGQPDSQSNAAVAKYFPSDWQKIIEQAADRAAAGGADDYATVPWTIVAGVVTTQTDFARYSPYDNIDRDPGRTTPDISPDDPGDGTDDTSIGVTTGAGPGPVSGVNGSGESTSLSPDHPGPPAGDLSHQLGWFMWALRMHESGGRYDVGNSVGACGAYQYINSTWNDYQGYSTACKAPPSVQDKRAVSDVLKSWKTYHTWQKIAAAHFYPAWASSTANWDRCPAACNLNPTVWSYVDDIMKKMREISKKYPATTAAPVLPAGFDGGPAAGATVAAALGPGITSGVPAAGGSGVAAGVFADGCAVQNPSPPIGGKGDQGTGPYLLNASSVADMHNMGLDPQSPCDSSYYVARKLGDAAKKVYADPNSPRWVPNGSAKDQENAREYWSKAIEISGIFVDRTADPDAPCAVPPPDDPKKPWSTSFKIISIWRCEIARMPELYLVTGGQYKDDKFAYTVEADRPTATESLVNEALSVSYGGSEWKTGKCDDKSDDRQGIFPMTKKEAAAAGVTDRCDVEKNIDGAAKLVLSVEKTPPEQRDKILGVFQPMVGGWQKFGIAMGKDLKPFSTVGPGISFVQTDACATVMTKFVTAIGPHISAFATLHDPPKSADLNTWTRKLAGAEAAHDIADPDTDPACAIGSWAPGFNAEIAQIAAGQAGDDQGGAGVADAENLTGLGSYYQAEESSLKPTDPVRGRDPLVVPRLEPYPLNEIQAPIDADATNAWSEIGTNDGVTLSLEQVAVDYAWFFGGVIAPFESAGKRIDSLANGAPDSGAGTVQVTVGPDGCPENAPSKTLLAGSDKIGIHKLCADSVAEARSPQAAMAIKWALKSLGWPYTQDIPARTTGRSADCSSFVSRAYRDSGAIPNLFRGNAPITTTFRQVPWTHQIPFSKAMPGDLVEPESGHVVMHLADHYNVQESDFGQVSHVKREYSSNVFWTGWVDASKV